MTFLGYSAGKSQRDLNVGLSGAESAISCDTFYLVRDPHLGMSWLSGLVPEATSSVSPTTLAHLPQEHFNYYSLDTALGHLVFSLKYDVIGDQEHLRLLLR